MVICPVSPYGQPCVEGRHYCCTLQAHANPDSGGEGVDAE